MTFTPFDPLEFKNTKINDAALNALRREISNILSSYVGWYDPFCELIQNALDAVEARVSQEESAGTAANYHPSIRVLVDLDQNALTVSDNGIGLDKEKFEQFLAPNFSFKAGATRGHKGVGATYVAYGFNYMRVTTKVPGFTASGRIVGAKTWLTENASASNPKVEPDPSELADQWFAEVDRGVSVTVRFDDSTHPRKLDWIKADTADKWAKILCVKTGLGSVVAAVDIRTVVEVRAHGETTSETIDRPSYLWLHKFAAKSASIREAEKKAADLFAAYGAGRAMPDKYRNLDFLYDTWTAGEIRELIGSSLDDEDLKVLDKHAPTISVEFGYTAKLWAKFNKSLDLRSNYRVLTAGIQLAANNMPQGEPILIPLTRNIGRQNQLHFLVHFNDYSPDMGRKGFHRELADFAKSAARFITENHLSKIRHLLKANTGVSPDLVRELKIGEWKKEMLAHESDKPLKLNSQHFFKPTERVSITSVPTREQDVIALFNQLVAGGVIRGIQVMSTNERFTYDGLYKIAFDLEGHIYIYDSEVNPLGVPAETADALQGQTTEPRVLEYKFSLDGLIEDFDNQDKNINDVSLCIVWETGEQFRERYGITSFLIPENSDQRQYHGVTHVLTDIESGAKHCDLIVLEELVNFLNDPVEQAEVQRSKYE